MLLSFILITPFASAYQTMYWNWKTIDPLKINFPKSFIWGTTTHAYEVEGNSTNNTWYASEKKQPGVTSDHWNRYREDIQLMKQIGLNSYCFSIAWDKVEPYESHFDEAVLQHYADICDELIRNGIKPIIILKDYRDPLWFAYNGGFEKIENITYFVRYAKRVFAKLANKAPMWITFWSPDGYAANGYLRGNNPPYKKTMQKFAEVLKNTLEAHVLAYKELKNMPNGTKVKIGITKHVHQIEPWNIVNPLDHIGCTIVNNIFDKPLYDFFTTGIFNIHMPVPTVEYYANVYHKNAYAPKSLDFIGINHHSHGYINNFKHVHNPDEIPTDITSLTVYPEGLYLAIKEVSENIAQKLDIPMYITQNGVATTDETLRDLYLKRYLYAVSKAIDDGFDVRGYSYWTLLDGFIWSSFDNKFGLIAVDHSNNLKRTIKEGAQYLTEVIKQSQ